MNKTWDVVVKLLAAAALTGGLTWGTYLQAEVDKGKATDSVLRERMARVEANSEAILRSLQRIEQKLDTTGGNK